MPSKHISLPGLPPPPKGDSRKALILECHDSPGKFNHSILGGSPFWWRQEEACGLIVKNHKTVLPWGNGLGKSHMLARVVLWWICTRPYSMAVTTAPTYDGLDGILWKNIRVAASKSRVPLGLHLTRKPLRADLGEDWGAVGIATTNTERVAGRHNSQLLAVVDEASGMLAPILEGIDSLIPTKIVEIGNPLRFDGRFKEDYDEALRHALDASIPEGERTVQLRVPSTDSPDARNDTSEFGMACGSWLRKMGRQYGYNSLWWQTHIRAEFPKTSTTGLIRRAWLDACTDPGLLRLRETLAGGRRYLSCDLGEGTGRDSSVILVRDRLGILELWESDDVDLDGVAVQYARLARKWGVPEENCSYDALGIGKKFKNKLEGQGITKAFAYQGGGSGGTDFTNLRGACAWAAANRLDPDWKGEHSSSVQAPFFIPAAAWWPRLLEELEKLEYGFQGRKIKLQSKEDLMDRLGRSPDRGDAFIQSFVHEVLSRGIF